MSELELLEEKEEIVFFEEDEDQENGLNSNAKLISELEEISRIIVSGTDWTTATILDQMVRENIILNPQFQRRDAWTINLRKPCKQQSIYLEKKIFLGCG